MKIPTADKTYSIFQKHFEMAQKVHKKALTAARTGYNETHLAQINISESANAATNIDQPKNEQANKQTVRTNNVRTDYP